ncbi:MAG TPA: M28 family metallopeptidase [Terracidiphilus sp.]|nr:M28 family metallopeptidase [Terracidiphilus sp.]
METDLPQGQGINAAADWISSQFDEISKQCGGCLEVHRDEFVADPAGGATWARRIPKPTRLTNIYAILRGTDPVQSRRMYLVSGHYDSRNTNVLDARGPAPGANDDASGVAVSLECARALSRMRFPATLVFAAVAGEEQGLVGSQHLAKLAHDQGWQLEAVLNNDIVGGNTNPGDKLQLKDRVRVFSEGIPSSATPADVRHIRATGEENDSPSRELARAVAYVGRIYFPAAPARFSAFLVFRPDRYLRGGDHSSFNAEGFAAVRFTEWREDYVHQHKNVILPAAGSATPIQGDLPQFVDFNYVSRVARLNAATLATLASSPGEPVKVTIVIKNMVLDNSTILSWQPPAGAPADIHYEVLWRETTAPDWQFVKRVAPQPPGTADTVTMPISGDNVVFGVQAVDAAGHRSLVVVP